jgi:hypothetical protein
MTMWYEDLPAGSTWSSLWHGYILCGNCGGIRRPDVACPACNVGPYSSEPTTMQIEGRDVVLYPTFCGAEGRFQDYIYLQMLQREWERPAPEFERFAGFPHEERPSARAALVLLFWTYFETRIERLLRGGMHRLPVAVCNELLDRHGSIGQRLYRLYKIIFDSNYFEDLMEFGFQDIAKLLVDVHDRRNKFAHGNPQAIDDSTVDSLVASLKREHEAWITVFNRRATKPSARGAST